MSLELQTKRNRDKRVVKRKKYININIYIQRKKITTIENQAVTNFSKAALIPTRLWDSKKSINSIDLI
jgi:hypothetical protein